MNECYRPGPNTCEQFLCIFITCEVFQVAFSQWFRHNPCLISIGSKFPLFWNLPGWEVLPFIVYDPDAFGSWTKPLSFLGGGLSGCDSLVFKREWAPGITCDPESHLLVRVYHHACCCLNGYRFSLEKCNYFTWTPLSYSLQTLAQPNYIHKTRI